MNKYEIAFFAAIEANAAGQLAQKTNDVLRVGNPQILDGFLAAIFKMVDAVVSSGTAQDQSIQKLDLLLALAENNSEQIGVLLSGFCTLCHSNRGTLKATPTEPKGAQKIEIVGMPDRAKVQTVERDAYDEITQTVTLETDA